MKLTDLKLNDKVKLKYIGPYEDKANYEFVGIVQKSPDNFIKEFRVDLWISGYNSTQGYVIKEQYNNLWNVELIK